MISIIIPALNEEKNIGLLISKLRKYVPSGVQIIVVDNGSEDNTVDVAEGKGVEVYIVVERGKGNAMKKGVLESREEVIVFIDGDGSYNPQDIKQLTKPIINGEADVVYGSRFLANSKREKMSRTRFLGNRMFAFLCSVFYQPISDPLTGLLAIKREAFLKFNLLSKGYEIEMELFCQAAKRGLCVNEIPIMYKGNTDSKLNTIVDGARIMNTLLKSKKK